MNLGLIRRPLAVLPDEKYNLGLYRLYIEHRVRLRRIDVAPEIQCNLLVVMTPLVTVVAALSPCSPAEP